MKKIAILLLITLLVQFQTKANITFNKANTYYQKGDYQNAIANYEILIKEGFHSSTLYYNLGSAYYKSNNTAAAILNLEKAHKLAPGDEDINFNLKMANLKVVDKITPLPDLFYKRWWKSLAAGKTAASWSAYSITLFWLFVLTVALFIISFNPFHKRLAFFGALILLTFSSITFALASQQHTIEQTTNTGIVFSPSLYVKSSPNERGVDLFILHEGAKVYLLDTIGSWSRIRIANGSEGWVQTINLQLI